MTDGSEFVSRAEALAARATELEVRAHAAPNAEEVDAIRRELDRLGAELAALEEEERLLDLGFDDPTDHRAAGVDTLGPAIGDVVSDVVDAVAGRLSDLGSTLSGDILGTSTGDALVESVAVDGPVPVRIVSERGPVSVVAGSDDEVRAEAVRPSRHDNWRANVTLDVRRTPSGVEIHVRCTRRRWRGVRLTVSVPARSDVDVETTGGRVRVEGTDGSATLRTAGGSIVTSGTDGRVEAKTAGGSIRVVDHRGSVDVTTSGGSIRLGGQLLDDVVAKTSGGSIRVSDVVGAAVRAKTSGGSVQVNGRLCGDSVISSSGGSLVARLSRDSNLQVEAKGSKVTCEFADLDAKGRAVSGVIGSGADGHLSLRTSGGSVSIREL